MSGCTYTVSNSVRMIDPVGQASRHAAVRQCLHTSDINSQENFVFSTIGRSTNATCRQVDAPRWTVLSYDMPVNSNPSSGNWFHCLHATSHALHPMQTVVAVKTPARPFVCAVLSGASRRKEPGERVGAVMCAPGDRDGCRLSTPWTPGWTRSGRRRTR